MYSASFDVFECVNVNTYICMYTCMWRPGVNLEYSVCVCVCMCALALVSMNHIYVVSAEARRGHESSRIIDSCQLGAGN